MGGLLSSAAERSESDQNEQEKKTQSPCLEVRPTLAELTEHVNVRVGVKWRQLGINLKLERTALNAIDQQFHDVSDKLSAMFEKWLDKNPTSATRRAVTEALRMKNVGEHTVANEYETKVISTEQKKACVVATSADTVKQPLDVSLEDHVQFINALTDMVEADRKLAIFADELKKKFSLLTIEVRKKLNSKSKLIDAKMLVRDALKNGFACNPDALKKYRSDLDAVSDTEQLLVFLNDNNFMSYLNYQLLENMSELCHEENITRGFVDYRKQYTKLLKCTSFDQVISVFKKIPSLKPATIIGFPLMKLRLERPEIYDNIYNCLESLSLPASSSHVADVLHKCIVITFSVFPSALLDILSYLTDPLNIEKLRSSRISVTLELHDGDINKASQALISKITAVDDFSSPVTVILEERGSTEYNLCGCGDKFLHKVIADPAVALQHSNTTTKHFLEEKEQKYFYIEAETIVIKELFAMVYKNVTQSMRNIEVDQLKSFVREMVWFQRVVKEDPSLRDRLDGCRDADSVFSMLASTGICSWFNHHPLKSLLDRSQYQLQIDVHDARKIYDEFAKDTLVTFFKRSFTETIRDRQGHDSLGGLEYLTVATDLNVSEISDKVRFLISSLRSAVGFSSEHLHLVHVTHGSVVLKFAIPLVISKEVLHRSVLPSFIETPLLAKGVVACTCELMPW